MIPRIAITLVLIAGCESTPEPPVLPPPQPKAEPGPATHDPPTAGPPATPDPLPPSPPPTTAAPQPGPQPETEPRGPTIVTFDADAPGGPAAELEAIIGDWAIGEHAGARGLWVDGTRWRQGTPSTSLAEQAKRLYGEHYAEFLDNVKAFAFYPVAVWTGEVPPGDLEISVRFYPEAGRIDQAAGIVWSLTPEGSYWGVRANPLEDNILYFDVARGKRTLHATIRKVPTPTHEWHTLTVTLAGGTCTVLLDGEERMSKPLEAPVTGRVGLWSKADSKVLFDDFTVRAR